jgi:uncharacterized protein (TIGR03435 family)
MNPMDDRQLLREYAQRNSEEAFRALAERYAGLVYHAALRQAGNPQTAEDVTQAVFIALARKADRLPRGTVLSGWLFRATRFALANLSREEFRRQRREQEAVMMQDPLQSDESESVWKQITPLLDDALDRLSAKDREVILLRFFQDKTHRETAETLGVTEDAAKVRVSRALEKLRMIFAARGVAVPSAVLLAAFATHGAQAAPAGLTAAIASAAVAKGATASASTLTLFKGALKIMAWSKAKTAIVSGVVVLLATGTATVTIKEVQKHYRYPWQVENADAKILERVPPQVMIVPTIFAPTQRGFNMSNNKMLGMGQTVSSLLGAAYQMSRYRVIYLTTPPAGNYDFIANLRTGDEANRAVLRQEIEKQFHLVARKEMRETDVLVLTVKSRNAPGLKPNPSKSSDANSDAGAGYWRASNVASGNIAGRLERYFKIPVIDRTGLAGRYDVNLKWDEQVEGQNPGAFKQVLLDQLGLELVPGREPIEMLVVEKAN